MMVSKEITKELIEYCKENEWWEVETKYLIEDLEKIQKDLEILEILKPYLKQVMHIEETGGGFAISFKPITFYIAKVMDLDFNFNDTENIKNIRKVKEWLENDNSK